MSTRSNRSRVTYRTYDDRAVSRETIEWALDAWEERQRRQERWRQIRIWALTILIIAAVVLASVSILWWRVAIPF